MLTARRALRDSDPISVPDVLEGFTTARVLVLERAPGGSVGARGPSTAGTPSAAGRWPTGCWGSPFARCWRASSSTPILTPGTCSSAPMGGSR